MLIKIKNHLKILPSMLFIFVFFIYGFIDGLLQSFGYNNLFNKKEFHLNFYKEVFENNDFWNSLLYTFKIASISTIISLVVSVVVLYTIFILLENVNYINILNKLIKIPVIIPYVIASYLIYIVLTKNGTLYFILKQLNIINTSSVFPTLTNDNFDIGIITTFIWKTVPFTVMFSYPILEKIKNKWNEVNIVYGINDFTFFKNVVFPLILPSLIVSSFIIFSFIFTSYETPFLLGRSNPQVLSVYALNIFNKGSITDRGFLMSVNIMISIFSGLIGLITYYLFSKYSNKRGVI